MRRIPQHVGARQTFGGRDTRQATDGCRASRPPNLAAPEAETVLPRLADATSVDDVRRVLHEEYSHWFSPDIAGDPAAFAGVAREIWDRLPAVDAR